MPDPLRHQLFLAIRSRFELIHPNNGYQTTLGTRFFPWRDLANAPFSPAELESFDCAWMLRDKDQVSASRETITSHTHDLTIECEAVSKKASPDYWARLMEADIIKAIGVDRQWTVDGTKLAIDTVPGSSEINVGHYGDRVAAVRVVFTVRYRTRQFDPYTQ